MHCAPMSNILFDLEVLNINQWDELDTFLAKLYSIANNDSKGQNLLIYLYFQLTECGN